MPTVTLLAQPRDKAPLLSVASLQRGDYEVRRKGTFGVLWFTDFGAAVWEACLQSDGEARLKLRDSGFDELDWTISFRAGDLKARLEAIRYRGKWGKLKNVYCFLKVNGPDANQLTEFAEKLIKNLGHPPDGFKDPGTLENVTDKSVMQIKEDWEEVLGNFIEWKQEGPEVTGKKAKKAKPKPAAAKKKLPGLGALTGKQESEPEATGDEKPPSEPQVQLLECPGCSADVPLPEEGLALKCPACGLEGEAPERDEAQLFECPACKKEIEVWTLELPETLQCPHCGVSGSLGGEEAEAPASASSPEEPAQAKEELEAKEEAGPAPAKAEVKAKAEAEADNAEADSPAKEPQKGKTEPLVTPSGGARPSKGADAGLA